MKMVNSLNNVSTHLSDCTNSENQIISHRTEEVSPLRHHHSQFAPHQIPQENQQNCITFGDYHLEEQEGKMQQSPYSFPENTKRSPGFLDWDLQFNFPSTPQGQAEVQQGSSAEKEEWRLNALMEVIEDDDRNEVSSTVSATPVPQRSSQIGHSFVTQPIKIEGPSGIGPIPGNGTANSYTSLLFDMTPPGVNFAVGVPPASDTRKYNMFGVSPADSSVANSPVGPIPFSRYQQESFFTAHSPRPGTSQPDGPRTLESNIHHADGWSTAYQATEDPTSPAQMAMSPAQMAFSPWQPAYASPGSNYSCDDVFVQEGHPLEPPQPRPDFTCPGRDVSADVPGCSKQVFESDPFPPKRHSSVMSVPSISTLNISDLHPDLSPQCAQLEEGNPRHVKDVGSPSSAGARRTSLTMTEQQRKDNKRVRNNIACRESRKRRKRRNTETEANCFRLEHENSDLKLRIKRLERDVKMARKDVDREMSQS